MASKKKSAAKPAKKPASAKAKPAASKPAPDRPALKWLATLPTLTELRRRAYSMAFTADQCREWGAKTKAAQVLADAEKALAVIGPAVKKGVDGYDAHRLTWLCTQMAELQDAIAHQAGGGDSAASRRAAVAMAARLRTKLAHALLDAASGNEVLAAEINNRHETQDTPSVLETTITGLLQLALRLRHTVEGEVLAEDAGLSESFLSSASAVIDALRTTNEETYGTGTTSDTDETNVVEGRVLRELHYAQQVFARAKARGASAPTLPALGTLKTALAP